MRTLERRFGAVCRAVAVRVAEAQHRHKTSEETPPPEAADQDKVHKELEDKAVLDAASEAAIAHPPEMPIVIDDLAVKDILGVSIVLARIQRMISGLPILHCASYVTQALCMC